MLQVYLEHIYYETLEHIYIVCTPQDLDATCYEKRETDIYVPRNVD